MAEDFSRDLGYLEKFFEKLEAHAGTLGGASGQRLRTLMSEERKRWGEIRSLIAGNAPQAAQAAAPQGASVAEMAADHPYSRALQRFSAQRAAEPVLREAPSPRPMGTPGFSVGPLKRR